MAQQIYPIDQIKDRVSVFDYARDKLGLRVSRPGARCTSFRQGATNTTSLLVNERDWWDFGSGRGGDVIDMCAQARHNGDFHAALRELADLAGITLREGRSDGVYRDLARTVEEFHASLTPSDREYLHARKITDSTIDALKIGRGTRLGMEGRVTIPYWKCGRPVYLVGRGENPKYKKLFRQETDREAGDKSPIALAEHPIWGLDSLGREGEIVIAEGAFDALSCWQEGLPVLSPITGTFSGEQLKDLISLLRGRKACVCLDHDPVTQTGQKAQEKLAASLFASGIIVRVVSLAEHAKDGQKTDLSELYAAGADLREVLAGGVDYVSHRIDQLTSDPDRDDQLKYLLRAAARWRPAPEVARWVARAKATQAWDPAWLAALAAELKRPPSEDEVVKDLRRKYKLIYHEQLGWYEYDSTRGLWVTRAGTEVEAYVAHELRHYRTGPRISSCMRVARSEFIRQAELNPRKDLLNLKNGMLVIDTESDQHTKLLSHDHEYYSTIQLGFAYGNEAECPGWMDFIEQVTAGDEKRQMFLQEFVGYCLTTDTRYQCACFMIGSGENGKSVLFDVLRSLVGRENVSHIEISTLIEPFQRINLHNKLINIAAETESSVKGTETIFKSIVTSDPINGRSLFRDFITFRPFCKMIFGANEYPETSDLSHGFLRRLKFINFPMRFVEHPDPSDPYEARKDRHVTDRLLNELPGIFNWALSGLAALRRQDGFTMTMDQIEMMKEYQEISNPLMGFYDEWDRFSEWRTRIEVYADYKNWCANNNTRPFSPRKFWPQFKRMVKCEEKTVNGYKTVYISRKEPRAA